MKKLFLIFHGRFPSEKAAALFAAKSAASFAKQGLDVTLLVPRRKNVDMSDPFAFYAVERNFKVTYLNTIDLFSIPHFHFLAFWVSFGTFSFAAYRHILKTSGGDDIIYSNESLPLLLISHSRKNCLYEMHDFPESKLGLFKRLLSRVRWILIHNKWKYEEAVKRFPTISPAKYMYEPNAVDIKAFDMKMIKEEARNKLGLPLHKKIAVYTGHLYGWKGVDTLAHAASLLPEQFLVVFVGGTVEDVKKFKEKYGSVSRVLITGFKPHEEIPLWQKAADMLVLPNTAKEKISAYYTSPMKLYEYMASCRPIIASDIPSIREIVDESSAVLVKPDDAKALAHALENTVRAEHIGEDLAKEAYKKVLDHTWDKRARRIMDFMNI